MSNHPNSLFPWYKHYDPDVPHHINYPNICIHQLFDAAAEIDPLRTCLIFNEEKLSYGKVQSASTDYARRLVTLGVKPGTRVGLILPNSPKFVIAFIAILRIGGIVTAINPMSTVYEIHYQVENAGVSLIIGDRFHRNSLFEAMYQTSTKILILEDVQSPIDHISDNQVYNPVVDPPSQIIIKPEYSKNIMFPLLSPESPAIFQYSGGTTGEPKAAIGTHQGIVANIYQFCAWLTSISEGFETWLSVIPFYHVYGMVIGLLVGIQKRATLVLLSDARDVKAIVDAAIIHQTTFLPGVPALFKAIIDQLESSNLPKNDFAIKVCISGSASLHGKTKSRFEELTGSRILEGYGLSEAPTATHCNPMQGENRIGSIGLPLPDVNCKIVDIETVLKDGWLFTGDIARMDQDGYFFLIDRKKDLIKVGGFQVWPKEVETVLMQHPSVSEAAVVGISTPDDNVEMIHAWIVLKSGTLPSGEELKKWCSKTLSRYKIPRIYHFIDELPKSSVGKTLKRVLRVSMI
jgi:long-chain acyl-CoA synthetase